MLTTDQIRTMLDAATAHAPAPWEISADLPWEVRDADYEPVASLAHDSGASLAAYAERGIQPITNRWMHQGVGVTASVSTYQDKLRDYSTLRRRQIESIEQHCREQHQQVES